MGPFAVLARVLLAASLALPPTLAFGQARGPESVADLARELSDAVVNIGTSRRVRGGGGVPFPDVPEGSPLEDFFNELNPNNGLGDERMEEARSLGSGFIINASGIVVTNNHVIEGAEEILVFLADGTRLPAQLIGADAKTDLAVLKVDAGRDLPFVEFGDSETAEVGDWVMAIGNPFGLGGSVTLGIVSARNRDINAGPYDNFIQTDAAINQGNSGGPLFDMDGKVVGINTAIFSRGGSSLGIGFAVPGNLARPVIDQLAEFGETRRGWLGVGIQDVSEDIALSLGRPDTNGALVVEVTPTGPSFGVLEDGDLILEFDGRPIVRMRDLPRIVAETEVGRIAKVRVLRNGEELLLDINLGRLETGEQMIAEAAQPPVLPEAVPDAPIETTTPVVNEVLGLELSPLTDAARTEYQIPREIAGVVITGVVEGGDAEDKGLAPGLVIEEVNQQAVGSTDEVAVAVDESREAGRPAVLLKVTDAAGTRQFIAVRLQ